MEKIIAQYGETVVTRRHLHPRRRLDGTLAGAVEVEQETLGAGVTSLVEAGGNRALKRPREAGRPLALLPRIHRPPLGTEQ